MTDLREAAADLMTTVQFAIKSGDWRVDGACDPTLDIERLRQALAHEALDEMVVDRGCYERGCVAYDERDGDGVTILGKRVHKTDKSIHEWVGLTDEEIYDYADKFLYQHGSNYGIRSFGKAIEARLKEKNS